MAKAKPRMLSGLIVDTALKGVRFVSVRSIDDIPPGGPPKPYTCDSVMMTGTGCGTVPTTRPGRPPRYAIMIECDGEVMTSREVFDELSRRAGSGRPAAKKRKGVK